jgi:hypothetical protein
MDVTKKYFEDLGEQDAEGFYEYAYRYWVYEFDFGDSRYAARRYRDTAEEASFLTPSYTEKLYEDSEFAAAVRYLVEEEGVERIDVLGGPSGTYEPIDLKTVLGDR